MLISYSGDKNKLVYDKMEQKERGRYNKGCVFPLIFPGEIDDVNRTETSRTACQLGYWYCVSTRYVGQQFGSITVGRNANLEQEILVSHYSLHLHSSLLSLRCEDILL